MTIMSTCSLGLLALISQGSFVFAVEPHDCQLISPAIENGTITATSLQKILPSASVFGNTAYDSLSIYPLEALVTATSNLQGYCCSK